MPRIATGYWNARNSPSRARSSGFSATRSLPRYCADPVVMVYAGLPASTCASVLFPDPFGPMMACTSPARTVRSTPRRISYPSIPAHRFLISSQTMPHADVVRHYPHERFPPQVDHLRPPVLLLSVVGHRYRIEDPGRVGPLEDASRVLPGDRGPGLLLRQGVLRALAQALPALRAE